MENEKTEYLFKEIIEEIKEVYLEEGETKLCADSQWCVYAKSSDLDLESACYVLPYPAYDEETDEETFPELAVAQAALDSGCIIYRHTFEDGRWRLIPGTALDVVQPDCRKYYFHIPKMGGFDVTQASQNQYVADEARFGVIEAGFCIPGKQEIVKNRLYIVTERYTDDGDWIPRPDMLTKVYNKLVRVVKKVAPYTELAHFVVNPMYAGEKHTSKEYISAAFYELVQREDYKLG